MPKTLASRLSSPPGVYKRLSLPSPPVDQDLPGHSDRHFKRHGHLPVQEQITLALEDLKRDRLRYRPRKHAPLVPRRKPLLPPVPQTQFLPPPPLQPVPTTASAPTPDPPESSFSIHIPLIYRIAPALPAFTRRNTSDTLAIIESKTTAVVRRLQALFDRKRLLEDAPHDQRLALQRVADRLEWILDHIKHEGNTWEYAQIQSVDNFCHAFAKIQLVKLRENFPRVLKAIAELESFGYLDWVHE